MADNRTMAQLLQAPTRGLRGIEIVIPKINANFELKHELHQLDTFYNALNANDQDSLNSAAGGNFLDKMPRECLRIIESKSMVRNSRNKAVVAKVSSNSSTPGISPDVAALKVSELKNLMKTMLIDKQKVQAPATVKAVEQSCVTCEVFLHSTHPPHGIANDWHGFRTRLNNRTATQAHLRTDTNQCTCLRTDGPAPPEKYSYDVVLPTLVLFEMSV
ncbi:hypothetical protein Tco_1109131 [Tanacetum coccineum]